MPLSRPWNRQEMIEACDRAMNAEQVPLRRECLAAIKSALDVYPTLKFQAEVVKLIARDLIERGGFRQLIIDDPDTWLLVQGDWLRQLNAKVFYTPNIPEKPVMQDDLDFAVEEPVTDPDLDFA